MKKTPSLFQRDWTDANPSGNRPLINAVNPLAQWVADGEGVPTVKWDGTCCMVRDGKLYKRFDRKKGKAAPDGWEPCQDAPDENTGHWPGWVPVGPGPEDRWHREGWNNAEEALADGTYELVGPALQGNPHNLVSHVFVRHGADVLPSTTPRTFDKLRAWFADVEIEGIVWHHPDGRLVKIKRKDFGMPWPVKVTE